MIATMVSVTRQLASVYLPLIRSGQAPTFRFMIHESRVLMLKPINLIPWAILVSSALRFTWKYRAYIPEEPGLLSLGVACSVSVVCFLVNVLFFR